MALRARRLHRLDCRYIILIAYVNAASIRSVWIFLARCAFGAEISAFTCWISLDFLVRIECFQWVMRDKRQKIISRGLYRSFRWVGLTVMAKSRIAHRASLD